MRVFTLQGDSILFTSRGRGRKWLDVTIGERLGVLLCYWLPFNGDFEDLRARMEMEGGAVNAASPSIEPGMTAVFMLDGSNYPVVISDVQIV